MEYKILSRSASSKTSAIISLEYDVEQYLKKGWLLQGGVNVCYDSLRNEFIISQAVIKTSTSKTN